MRSITSHFPFVFIALLTGPDLLFSQITTRTVAVTNQQAPGTASGVTYQYLFEPVVNSMGQVAVSAQIAGPGVTSANNQGLWIEDVGGLSMIARTSGAAPGTPLGVQFSALYGPVLNSSQQVAFTASLSGSGVTSSNDVGIWSGTSGSLRKVARAGDAAAGTAVGVMWSKFSFSPGSFWDGSYLMNSLGQVAFLGFLTGSGVTSSNNQRLWSEGSGSLQLLARTGSTAPGTGGAVYNSFSTGGMAQNDAGHAAFYSILSGIGTTSANNRGVWSSASGATQLVVRSGQPAPGAAGGTNFFDFSVPAVNNANEVAFYGTLAGGASPQGLWVQRAVGLKSVAVQGQAAPGTPAGVTFNVFPSLGQPVINDQGRTAFKATVAGPGVTSNNREAIWSADSADNVTLIARGGDHAPGIAGSISFSSFGDPALSKSGQVAFTGSLQGSGIFTGNDSGLWATDLQGQIQLVARESDLWQIAPGDSRLITTVSFITGSGGEDGRYTTWSDSGGLAFRLGFSDGSSGVFMAFVPEPVTLTLFGLAAAAMTCRPFPPQKGVIKSALCLRSRFSDSPGAPTVF